LVSRSDAIVLAKAREVPSAQRNNSIQNEIEFEIKQVVKGSYTPKTLVLSGTLVRSKVIIRDYVDCVPVTYAEGRHYLLFLKRIGDKIDLLWFPRARVNAQVRGRGDPWVKEVLSRATSR
jgi:hypothetical protein